MKEERLNKDLKYFVTKQLSNLPKFMESWSQSCARAHFVSPHPCPTVGSLLPALSALLPLCSQQRRLERRRQEQAGGREPDPFQNIVTQSLHFLCLPLPGASGEKSEDFEMYLENTGAQWSQRTLAFCQLSCRVCLQDIQTRMKHCLSRDVFFILPAALVSFGTS